MFIKRQFLKLKLILKKEEGKCLTGTEWLRYNKVLNVPRIKLDPMK